MWHRFVSRIMGIGVVFCMTGLAANAQTSLSLYTGFSKTQNSDLHVRQPSTGSDAVFRDIGWVGRPFENPPYYGYRITHYLKNRPQLGFAVDFTHYKMYANPNEVAPVSGVWNGAPVNTTAPLNERVQEFSISHGVNTLSLNVLYRWLGRPMERFPQGRLQPYVGGGLAYYILHPENTVNNQHNDEKYEGSGVGLHLLGGVSYALTPRISLFTETKFDAGKAKVNTGGQGKADTDIRTFHLLGGVSYQF